MRVDTHIHSSYSKECTPDVANPGIILKAARKSGVDGFCIADHDTVQGYLKAKRIRRPGDPEIIPACEVSTSRGHLLTIGVERCWDEEVDPYDVVDAVRSEGGVVSAPHPFYLSRISVIWLARELGLAIEGFNALASVLIYPNPIARKFASKYDLPITAGSDSHTYEMVGWGITETEGSTVDGFISDVARGRARIHGRRPGVLWGLRFAAKSATAAVASIAHIGSPRSL